MAEVQTYGQHTRKLLVLGVPLIGSNVAHIVVGFTDTIMLGWYSVEALAAQVLGFSIYFVVMIVGSGFAFGIMPMVAQHAEAGEVSELRRVTRMGIWASVAFAAVFLPILLMSETIFRALGQEEEIIPLASDYMDVLAWALFPVLIAMCLRSYLSALERTQIILWVSVFVAVLNAILNWVFIFGNFGAPEMGVKGSAVATLVSEIFFLLILAGYSRWAEPTHEQALGQ